jgi:hypothetical protein
MFGMAWICLERFEYVWKGLNMFGYVWKGLNMFRKVWICLVILRYFWIGLELENTNSLRTTWSSTMGFLLESCCFTIKC